jgi:hypothetical protein
MFLGPRRPICTDAWPSRNLACRASWTLVLGSYIHLCTARAWCKRGPPKNKPGQAPCATQGRPPARNNARTRDELSSSARSAFTRLNEEWIMAYVPDLRILRSVRTYILYVRTYRGTRKNIIKSRGKGRQEGGDRAAPWRRLCSHRHRRSTRCSRPEPTACRIFCEGQPPARDTHANGAPLIELCPFSGGTNPRCRSRYRRSRASYACSCC